MRSTIYDLLYGNRGTVDTIQNSQEYTDVMKEYKKRYDELEATLNDEQKRLLDELYYYDGLVESELEITFYEEGFKMATRLLTDALK